MSYNIQYLPTVRFDTTVPVIDTNTIWGGNLAGADGIIANVISSGNDINITSEQYNELFSGTLISATGQPSPLAALITTALLSDNVKRVLLAQIKLLPGYERATAINSYDVAIGWQLGAFSNAMKSVVNPPTQRNNTQIVFTFLHNGTNTEYKIGVSLIKV
jgi:hypothetical protein